MPLSHSEHASKFRLGDHQALIGDARIDRLPYLVLRIVLFDLIANRIDKPLAGGKAASCPLAVPTIVSDLDDPGDAIPRRALTGLGAFTDEHGEQICVMASALDLVVRAIADNVSGARQELDQDRDRVGLGVRLDCPHYIAR